MNFTELTEEEFTSFVENHPTKNFFQSIYMKKRYDIEGKETYLVGVKKDNKVIAASLLVVTSKTLGYKNFEALKGFILDYDNFELLKFMTTEVKKFLKNKHAFSLYIDPYIPNISRDNAGNRTDKINNTYIKKYLKKLGYHEIGEYTQVKWTYCLDINSHSKEELFKNFKPNARNCINKTLTKYNIIIRELSYEELPLFKKITSETCKRHEIPDRSLSYYQNMYKAFQDKVKFLICELDCQKYIENLEKEITSLHDKIAKLSSSPSNDKKKSSYQEEIKLNENHLKEIINLQKTKGNIIPLSCGMFILYQDEIVYLFSGSYEKYMNYFGQYRIQWAIISYAADNHYKRYNFYGIKDPTKNVNHDGVLKFKQNFNGYIEELLGTFLLPINKISYLYNILKTIKHLGK